MADLRAVAAARNLGPEGAPSEGAARRPGFGPVQRGSRPTSPRAPGRGGADGRGIRGAGAGPATGRLPGSTRALQRTIGAALSAHSRATTRVQADDEPDISWDHPELERLFERLVDEFELEERSAALDRKLTLTGETTTTLLTLVQARRTYVVELAIVLLILIEVVKSFYESLAR